LTDKHNHTDLLYAYLIQRSYVFHLATSAIISRNRFTKTVKRRQASPNKKWCKILWNSDTCYSENGI